MAPMRGSGGEVQKEVPSPMIPAQGPKAKVEAFPDAQQP